MELNYKMKGDNQSFYLRSFIPIVKGLGRTLGRHFEIVLHDIKNKESSIIAIENGHITGREIGAPVTDLLMKMIHEADESNMKLNYTSKNKDGKPLRSSTFLIRNNDGEITGAMCMNIDLTSIKLAKSFLDEISFIEDDNNDTGEYFPENTNDFLGYMIKKGMGKLNKPVYLTDKGDKLLVVKYLYNNNVFNIKGAVDIVARELNVSRYTVYNYIDEIQASQK